MNNGHWECRFCGNEVEEHGLGSACCGETNHAVWVADKVGAGTIDTQELRGLLPRFWTLPVPTHDYKNLVAHLETALAAAREQALEGLAQPTDIAQQLRAIKCFGPEHFELLTRAADECDRFYGGMMAWKESARAAECRASTPPSAPVEYAPEYATLTDHNGKVTGVRWTNADKRPPASAPAGVEGLDWSDYERIADLPDVHEALQGFSEDATGDNGVCVVRAILTAVRGEAVAPVVQDETAAPVAVANAPVAGRPVAAREWLTDSDIDDLYRQYTFSEAGEGEIRFARALLATQAERQPQAAADVERDATRYRFIRDVPHTNRVHQVLTLQQNTIMDEEIDAAIQQSQQAGKDGA